MINIHKSLKETRDWIEALSKKEWGYEAGVSGYCAIASAYLYLKLKKQNLEPKIVELVFGECGGHCYVLLENVILDVTADQFSGPEIACVDASRDDLPYYWDNTNVYKIYDDITSFYAATGPDSPWPREQRPLTYKNLFNKLPEEI